MHVAVVGGGSGGHVTPVVALLRYIEHDIELREKCKEISWFGERDGQEFTAVQLFPWVTFVPVTSGKRRRYDFRKTLFINLLDMIFVIKGFFVSLIQLRKRKVTVVFCKGSHVAIPVCLAAAVLGIPIVLHESDSLPGLANRIVAKRATIKFAGFPEIFGPDTQVSGQLLSTELLHYNQTELWKGLVPNDKTNVLVMGGSQGSTVIYETLANILTDEWTQEFHFYLILGKRNEHLAERFLHIPQVTTFLYLNVDEVASLCAYCDLSITRGGVTSLAEQQLFGLKKAIVPLPFTGGNHQEYNARWYVEKYGDVCLLQDASLQQRMADFLDRYRHFKKTPTYPSHEELSIAPHMIRKTLFQLGS